MAASLHNNYLRFGVFHMRDHVTTYRGNQHMVLQLRGPNIRRISQSTLSRTSFIASLLGLVAIPTLVFAATPYAPMQGVVHYDRHVAFDFDIPEQAKEVMELPGGHRTAMALHFGPQSSIMVTRDEEAPAGRGRRDRATWFVEMMKRSSASRSDQESISQTYVDFDDGSITETRDFMGRTFRLSRQRPVLAWKLVDERSAFLDFEVQKATARMGDSIVEAWFTPQIPVPAGPDEFGGLPGLILVLAIDSGKKLYTATSVEIGSTGDVEMTPPDDGTAISLEEYEQIVEEKLEELRAETSNNTMRFFRPF